MAASIGIFYGSSTCYTEFVAERIQQRLGEDRADLHNIAMSGLTACLAYDFLIFGIPTWDYGELQEDWDRQWDQWKKIDLTGKQAAVFGLGDQLGYPNWFQDAMGYLYDELRARGADLVGHWPNRGYQFNASAALTEDRTHFVGLALDEENEPEKTDSRIEQWLASIGIWSK
jgi:flavodoxin II